MRSKRRSDRPDPARGRPISKLEALEPRVVLSSPSSLAQLYAPTELPPRTVNSPVPPITTNAPYSTNARQLSFLDTEGKVVTGKDRQGDEYTITVHGPGSVIVTDTSPADGVLDDDINTIQLVGTSLTDTYVTGQVVASARVVDQSAGTVYFNHLIDQNGVKSIILNGFTLARTATASGALNNLPAGAIPEVYLPGGVQFLQFHDILATINTANPIQPFNIVIGDPNTPMTVMPSIRLDSIFNSVFDSTVQTNPAVPQVDPTVNILVNGQIQSLDIISSTASPIPAAFQYQFPTVGTTGRTAIRAQGINNLSFAGSATNVTVARQSIPFATGFSGIDHLGRAEFGGNADAVGLDVSGPIGKLVFARGLGNPTGTSTAATSFGTPASGAGYPAYGLLGGLVTATRIGSIKAAPANEQLLTATDPDYIMKYRQGSTTFYPRAGTALTNAAIVSSGSIGSTTVVGDSQNSQVSSGFHYGSFVAGLEPTRAPSTIRPVNYRGDLIDTVLSSTYRPNDGVFGNGNDTAGPGAIRGKFTGAIYLGGLSSTPISTPLNNLGSGFFARHKSANLPPPYQAKRVASVLNSP